MSEKILIVDDDVDSLKLIGLMLKRNGYEVVAADTGTNALAKADTESPDLIILDVMMPDMSGLEVCRRLRANANTVDIPIIMFTAKTLIDDKVKGFEAGADDYLTKPTHPAELASRVKSILTRNTSKKQVSDIPATISNGASPPSSGSAIGVLGVKGGVGVTSIVVNVSVALLQSDAKPVIAELRPGSGNIGLMLGMESQGLEGVSQQNTINDQALEDVIVTHQSGLRALTASHIPAGQFGIHPDKAVAIVKALRNIANPVIVDMGAGITPQGLKVANELDSIYYVIEPTPLAVAMAMGQLQMIENEIGTGKINLIVLNRSQGNEQLQWQEIEQRLGREIKALIAAAPDIAFQSQKNRAPMIVINPTHVVSNQYIQLAEAIKTQ